MNTPAEAADALSKIYSRPVLRLTGEHRMALRVTKANVAKMSDLIATDILLHRFRLPFPDIDDESTSAQR